MRTCLVTTTVLWILLAGAMQCAAAHDASFIAADSHFFQYLGAWQTNGTRHYTIYPGSQVRFCLKGKACVSLRSGVPGTIRAMIRRGEAIVWDDIVGNNDVEIDAGSSPTNCSVVFLTTNTQGFDPASRDTSGAELRFEGLSLGDNAVLEATPANNGILLDFVGDSITAGVAISGRSGTWAQNSNASLTYAFRLAERLGSRYRVRAFPGCGCGDIADKFSLFQKGIPLSTNEQPDIVFVNVAANDREKGTPRYRNQMRNLLDVIIGTYPKARIVLLNFCRMTPNRLPVLEELAKAYPNGKVSCFDARPYLVGYSDEGVHPDAESHRRLSYALADDLVTRLPAGTFQIRIGSGSLSDGRTEQ